MDEETARKLLDKLASGKINESLIEKSDFLIFRKYLVERPDFKHFRGVAQHGGNVIYYYMEEPRS